MAEKKTKKSVTQEDIQSLSDKKLLEAFFKEVAVMGSVGGMLWHGELEMVTTFEEVIKHCELGELVHLELLHRLSLNKIKKQPRMSDVLSIRKYWQSLRTNLIKVKDERAQKHSG